MAYETAKRDRKVLRTAPRPKRGGNGNGRPLAGSQSAIGSSVREALESLRACLVESAAHDSRRAGAPLASAGEEWVALLCVNGGHRLLGPARSDGSYLRESPD